MQIAKKIILCTECLELNDFGTQKCTKCNQNLKLNDHLDLLDESPNIVFYGYQQRKTIEGFIERAPKEGPIPSAFHIPYNEIFEYLALTIVAGLSFDAIKFVAIIFYKSIKSKNIKLQSSNINYELTQNEELIKQLATDNEKLSEFISYINEYEQDVVHADERVSTETVPIDHAVIKRNRVILNELLNTVELKSKLKP